MAIDFVQFFSLRAQSNVLYFNHEHGKQEVRIVNVKSEKMKIIRLASGIILSIIGLMGVFFGILSIHDPIGAQLADDHNPFAKPSTISESIWVSALFFFLLLTGILLLFGSIFKRKMVLNKRPDKPASP